MSGGAQNGHGPDGPISRREAPKKAMMVNGILRRRKPTALIFQTKEVTDLLASHLKMTGKNDLGDRTLLGVRGYGRRDLRCATRKCT
ncbi:hypothetical protein KIN20_025677 [Parelaphostrongylus tenuis]|uniref:Uncharacterized protein n=1 Tax=Parelaphostrongylus tenuis TaxID=148309 RepID=A0AAD5N935_PARTN|nr:hypothetical protein KIN20_025677 [Parelaphostrongylus tenuis]